MSSVKGGTLIAEAVRDLDEHLRRLGNPDEYRPKRCPQCGHDVLHVHSYPRAASTGEPGMPPVVRVVQFRCAADACSATWRILPMFLARHLWRVWKTVERVVLPDGVLSAAPTVPERTRCRWSARLAAAARVLVVLFAASGGSVLEAVAAQVGLDASRAELVHAHAEKTHTSRGAQLAAVAAQAHRLERGIRLM